MKKWSAFIASFLGIYLVLLIVLMPAGVVFNWLTLPKNIQLGDVSGSIWQSKVSAIKVDNIVITNVGAKLDFFSLFLWDPKIDVTFGDALISGPEGKATISGVLSTLKLSAVRVNINADFIAQQINLPLPIKAHDFIDISLDEYIAGNALCSALKGNIAWSKAAVTALDEKISLGKLSADISCQSGDVVVKLAENNDLGLSFTASVGKGFAMSGDGYLTPNEKTPDAIRQVLPFLGKTDNQGRYRLRF